MMEAAEFACTREGLGLSVKWMADWLGVSERKLKRWEDGLETIPGGAADAVFDLDVMTQRLANDWQDRYVTYRTDADAREDGIPPAPALTADVPPRLPASWHRALTWRRWREFGGPPVTYYVPFEERT